MPPTWLPTHRRAATAVLVVAAVGIGAAAQAVWGGAGSGSGVATSGTVTAATLTPATASPGLYPGGTTDVALTIGNPDAAAVRVGSLALDTGRGSGGFAVDAGHPACTPLSVLSLPTQTNSGAGWTVPARVGAVDGTRAVTLTGALAMSTAAANACQGATFTVYLVAGP